MTFSPFIPTWRGWLALADWLAVAAIMPLLIPFYDPSGVSPIKISLAFLMAISTGVICFRCLYEGRGIDRFVALLTFAYAVWMFYAFIESIA